jgi:hypothetical protein
MAMLASVLLVLFGVSVVWADDEQIVKRLVGCGVEVGYYKDGSVWVYLDEDHLDRALPELCELRGLSAVKLNHQRPTEEQLCAICLPQLRMLWLHGVPMTDKQMRYVGRLRNLRYLVLRCTYVTDTGITELDHLVDLRFLDLESTEVTDAGLRHLETLSRLEHLDVSMCPNITNAGVARLQKALPKCKILRPVCFPAQ